MYVDWLNWMVSIRIVAVGRCGWIGRVKHGSFLNCRGFFLGKILVMTICGDNQEIKQSLFASPNII